MLKNGAISTESFWRFDGNFETCMTAVNCVLWHVIPLSQFVDNVIFYVKKINGSILGISCIMSHDIRTRIWFKIRMSNVCTPETRTTYSNIYTLFFLFVNDTRIYSARSANCDGLLQIYREKGMNVDNIYWQNTEPLLFLFGFPLFYPSPPTLPSPIRQFETIQHICISYNGTEKAPSKIEIPENLTRKMERQLFISPKNKRYVCRAVLKNRSISICLFLFTSSAKTLQYVYIICVAACIARHSASVLMVVVIATPHHIFPQPPLSRMLSFRCVNIIKALIKYIWHPLRFCTYPTVYSACPHPHPSPRMTIVCALCHSARGWPQQTT